MTTKDEVRSTVEALSTERALKLALEVLGLGDDASLAERDQAITAIRSVLNEHGEALAERALERMAENERELGLDYMGTAPATELRKQQSAERVEPVAWHDKIKGMEVSMDVSTSEDDAHNRIYGRVYEVILEDGEGTPNAILAIEEDRNFTSPPNVPPARANANAGKPWVGLTEEEAIFMIENESLGRGELIDAIESKLKEKNGF